MRYPTLTHTRCAALASQMVQDLEPSIDVESVWIGTGTDIDLEPISILSREVSAEARTWTDPDRDRFEGQVSGRLHEALEPVPTEVLDDRGFWRYLGLRYFWTFIAWREEDAFGRGNHLKYVDGISSTETVLTRMYLRAGSVGGTGRSSIVGAIPYSTDFWRSHILRVRTGSAPSIARAFAKKHEDARLATNPLRRLARSLNRNWTNIVLHLYDDAEATNLISELWPESEDE